MFDIGFSELLVIAIVALIVIGPQRLPKVARTLGHLFGRMQRYVNDVKADISREMELDELKKMQASMEDTARSFQDSVNQSVNETEKEMHRLAEDTRTAVDAYKETPASGEPAASATLAASPQGELPLEPAAPPPAQKQA
jgi:sec-independent protein translocase protein TatB